MGERLPSHSDAYDKRKSCWLMHYGQFPTHNCKIAGKERTNFSSHILRSCNCCISELNEEYWELYCNF